MRERQRLQVHRDVVDVAPPPARESRGRRSTEAGLPLADDGSTRLLRYLLEAPVSYPWCSGSPGRIRRSALTVGPADAPEERQADLLADRALHHLRTARTRTPGGRGQPICRVAEVGPAGGVPSAETERRITAARGGGRPLAAETRDRMEQAFGGVDFSGVRLHTGRAASDLSDRIQARAFTVGSDVFLHDGAYRPGSAAGDRLLGHELAHVAAEGGDRGARRSAAAVRRALDPRNPGGWPMAGISVEVMTGGSANFAMFKLSEGGSSVVVKFTSEDPRRVQFGERVLTASGVVNAQTNAIRYQQAGGVITHISNAATASGDARLQEAVATKLDKAREAQFVAIMRYVPGGDMINVLQAHKERRVAGEEREKIGHVGAGQLRSNVSKVAHYRAEIEMDEGILADASLADAHAEARQRLAQAREELPHYQKIVATDTAHLEASGWANDTGQLDLGRVCSADFLKGLGRMMVADAVVGNSDRLSTYVDPQYGDTTVLNAANWKVIARHQVGAIDNDTVLFSLNLLAEARAASDMPAPNPGNWAMLLVGGGEEHVSAPGREGLRHTQGVAGIFDPTARTRLYEKLIDELARSWGDETAVRAHLPQATFDQHFSAGVGEGLTGIRAAAQQLLADAAVIGGEDRGGGLIDADALRVNLAYIEARLASATADPRAAHGEAAAAATKVAWSTATGFASGQAEVVQAIAELQGLLAFNPRLEQPFPIFEDPNFFDKGLRKGKRQAQGTAADEQKAELIKGWARETERRSLADVEDVQGQLDALKDAGDRRRQKAAWALAHLRLKTDIAEKTEQVRLTYRRVNKLIVDRENLKVPAPYMQSLVDPIRDVRERLEAETFARYRQIQARERMSVKAPRVGRNPAAKELGETDEAMAALEHQIKSLFEMVGRMRVVLHQIELTTRAAIGQ